MKDWNPILMLALFIAACFVAAGAGAVFTSSSVSNGRILSRIALVGMILSTCDICAPAGKGKSLESGASKVTSATTGEMKVLRGQMTPP